MGFLSSIISVGAPLLGGILGDKSDENINSQNVAMNKEFAQMGIRWKVADAKAAGIHPLAALGAQTMSPSFQYAGGGNTARAVAGMGQDISRAIDSTRSPRDRLQARVDALTLERGQLENDLLRTQIAKLNTSQVGPAFPGTTPTSIPGQPDSRVVVLPSEVIHSERGSPSMQAGKPPSSQLFRSKHGGFMHMPSEQMKRAMEDDLISTVLWNVSERLPWGMLDPRNYPGGRLFRKGGR